jgi:hypothetical protein
MMRLSVLKASAGPLTGDHAPGDASRTDDERCRD